MARALVLTLFGLSWPLLALAQEPSEAVLAEARAWYRDGLSLEAAGDWAQALARFERVSTVKFTPQVRFHVARCKEHLGRMTEALREYRLSEYEAERDGLPELVEIRAARMELEARLPKIAIHRGPGAEQATIRLDGVVLGAASIGTDLAVDPGPHHVHAESPGRQDFERTVEAQAGLGERVEVTLEALPESAPRAAVPSASGETSGSSPASSTSVSPRESASPLELPREPWPWVAGGVALASAGAGAYFLVARSRAIDVQKEHCVGRICDEEFRGAVKVAEKDEARHGRLAVAAFSFAGLAAGTAATLWVLERRGARQHAGTLGVGAAASDRDLGVLLWGKF